MTLEEEEDDGRTLDVEPELRAYARLDVVDDDMMVSVNEPTLTSEYDVVDDNVVHSLEVVLGETIADVMLDTSATELMLGEMVATSSSDNRVVGFTSEELMLYSVATKLVLDGLPIEFICDNTPLVIISPKVVMSDVMAVEGVATTDVVAVDELALDESVAKLVVTGNSRDRIAPHTPFKTASPTKDFR